MRYFSLFAAVYSGGPAIRGFKDHQVCLAVDNIMHTVPDGHVECSGQFCSLKCNEHFHTYGGPPRVRCKQHSNQRGISWNKPIGTCRTCTNLQVDNDLFKTKCNTLRTGLKRCIVTCKNRKGIQPINKRRAITVCKCIWNKDKDDRCHWRIGTRIIDMASFDIYSEKWNCGIPPTKAPTVTTALTPPVFRIPSNLVCHDTGGDRIVGGVEAIPHSWPWMASMNFGSFICGGTIIDDETIISAAHCCQGFEDKPQFVRANIGEHNKRVFDLGQKEVRARSITVHPDFQRRTLIHDICVVKVEFMNLRNRHTAAPACLPAVGSHPPHGTRCWAAGWGRKTNRQIAVALQEVDLNIISDEVCATTANKGHLIKDSMFCAGYLSGGKDGCQGDSGGPLICEQDGQPMLTGVTSWGFGCGSVNSPGVWTKVESYTAWIRTLMRKS